MTNLPVTSDGKLAGLIVREDAERVAAEVRRERWVCPDTRVEAAQIDG
jgi:hypothetical protein